MKTNFVPLRDRATSQPLRDKADKGAFPIERLETLIRDCEEQPAWRDRADQAHAYYDGDQLTEEQRVYRRERSISERPVNLIGRVINGVLGQQARQRRDPRIEPDTDAFADVAEAVSQRLQEVMRETKAHMAISNAYGSAVKGGIGWVEVSRSSDPLDYPIRVQDVHRSEIWWDWRCKSLDIAGKAKWLLRAQWHDLDDIKALMPEHAELLDHVGNDWHGLVFDDMVDERWVNNYEQDQRFGVHRGEWLDGGRRRIKLYEVWYRVAADVVVMRLPGDMRWRAVEEDNPLHQEALARGMVKVKRTTTMQVRRALFAGPYRLIDQATKRRRFPYQNMTAFRKDGDNTPFGLIEWMIAPQDGYNERRARIDWMLKAMQLIIDSDALDTNYNTIADIEQTMMRPDMVAVLNPTRRNANGMTFRNDLQLQSEQWQSMLDDKGLMQDVAGVYGAQLGNAPAGVTAGNAMATLVEQGEQAMGELNDNAASFETSVIEAIVDLICEDMQEPNLSVNIGAGSSQRVVVLNTTDEQGRPINVVKDAPISCGLSEIPASPAYKAQQQKDLASMIQALGSNPQASALLTPLYIEMGSHPGRKQIADDLRRMSGIPNASDKDAQAKQQEQAAAQQQEAAEMAKAAAQAEVRAKNAKALLDETRAEEIQVTAALAPIQQGHAMAMDTAPQVDPEEQAIREAMAEAHQGQLQAAQPA